MIQASAELTNTYRRRIAVEPEAQRPDEIPYEVNLKIPVQTLYQPSDEGVTSKARRPSMLSNGFKQDMESNEYVYRHTRT